MFVILTCLMKLIITYAAGVREATARGMLGMEIFETYKVKPIKYNIERGRVP